MLEDYKFLHNIAGDHVAKFTIPSPNMLIPRGQGRGEVYDSHEEFVGDLTLMHTKKAVQAFYNAGTGRYL